MRLGLSLLKVKEILILCGQELKKISSEDKNIQGSKMSSENLKEKKKPRKYYILKFIILII